MLTPEAARGLLLRGHKRGDWVVSGGLSHAYDCFDCQYLYFGDKGDTTLEYLAEYKIHKSDGDVRWNQADYVATNTHAVNAHFDPAQAARLSLNASDYGGLFHAEDWRILAVDEKNADPQWLALYYCGGAPGVQEAYEGACMLTIDGTLPTDLDAKAAYVAAYAKANITLDCVPNNANCTGHPEPPFPPGR